MAKDVIVIGAGFGGMSAAAHLAKAGHKVKVYEKNSMPGGRAQVFKKDGFVFDMGPSWYMMPDVFEDFFATFDKKPEDYYKLDLLNPTYKVVTGENEYDVEPFPNFLKLVEELDPPAVPKFKKFFEQAEVNYNSIKNNILDSKMTSISDALDPNVLKFLASKDMYQSYSRKIDSITSNKDLRHILKFMSVFMGGSPKDIPAVYTILAYVDLGLKVYYPQGGFGAVALGFEKLCKELGVEFSYNAEVESINDENGEVKSITVSGKEIAADIIIANADYHHVETKLLSNQARQIKQSSWDKKHVSPTSLLIFLGLDTKLEGLLHHSLFFDTDWEKHFSDIKNSEINEAPLFYMSVPSLSDRSVAPKGKENLFILAPMPSGVDITDEQIDVISENIFSRISKQVGVDIKDHIEVIEVRTNKFFEDTYNAYKGNSFGLSHTLTQSAIFRPKVKSTKLGNLYFVGQFTNPGTGVPMVVISGKVVSNLIGE